MANFNYNRAIIGGRLTADPELKTTQSGISVTSFTVAVNRRVASKDTTDGQRTADFINCVAWRQTAEFITKYFRKGSSIAIEGTIQTRDWTDNNNQKRYATEVVVDNAMFVDAKGENEGRGNFDASYSQQPSYSSRNDNAGFSDLSNTDDLPF